MMNMFKSLVLFILKLQKKKIIKKLVENWCTFIFNNILAGIIRLSIHVA